MSAGMPSAKVSAAEYGYFHMGLTVGNLNAHGATLPTSTLADPKNYILRQDGKTIISPLAPLHELRPIHEPPGEPTVQEILGVLRPLKAAIPADLWLSFGAGYLKSMEETGPNSAARAAFRSLAMEDSWSRHHEN
jgi:hypothetical protein